MVLPLAGILARVAVKAVASAAAGAGDPNQRIEVEIVLGRDIVQRLKRMKRDMRQQRRRPVHEKVGETLIKDTTRNLRGRKTADGGGLAGWQPRTIALRAERGITGNKILIARGRMIRNMRNDFKVRARGTETLTIVEPRGKKQQNKAKFHQFGSRNVPFSIGRLVSNPARPFMGMQTNRMATILRLFEIFFNQALERHSN